MNKTYNINDFVFSSIDKQAFFKIKSINKKIATIRKCDNLQGKYNQTFKIKLSSFRNNYINL